MSDYTNPQWPWSALLVIDMQVDFAEGGASSVSGTAAITANVRQLAADYRQAGLPVVHIVRLYVPGGSDVDPPRRAMIEAGAAVVAPGSPGSAIIAGVATGSPDTCAVDADLVLAGRPQVLGENEIVLFKPRWGAFYRTDLQAWLSERGVDTVVVAGCNLPNCPRATLFEASERDYRTVLAKDAVSQGSAERFDDLAGIGVTLLSVAEIAQQLTTIGLRA
jgi:nicotinamidase-related amidase